MTLVKIVVTMHNTKNYFLKMFKIYSQLRNALIKFSNIKSIVVLKLETKKLVENGLGKNLTNLYLLSGKPMRIYYKYGFRSFLSQKQV